MKLVATMKSGIQAVTMTLGVKTSVRLERLQTMDLSKVQGKLMHSAPEGQGWTEEQASEAEKWYKRYLAMVVTYPDLKKHIPNAPIDAFWHQHILDTMAYAQDCEHVLGFFLHHNPYFGSGGDNTLVKQGFDRINALYRKTYGEDCTEMVHFVVKKGKDCCSDCDCSDGE